MKTKKQETAYIQEKPYKLNITWILLVFLVILVLSYFYVGYVKELIYQNVYQNIKELSQQTATQLNQSITEQKKFVQIMVESIDRGYFETPEEIFDRFVIDLENYHFTRLVILDKQGNGTTSDGHVVSNYPNMQEFFEQQEVYVSENRPSTVSDNQVNIYSKTFTLKGEEKVLMATINTADYQEILLRRLFGKGGTYLINNDGTVLIDSFNNIKESNANIYDYIKNKYTPTTDKEKQKIDEMAKAIKNKQTGTLDAKLGEDTYFIHYEKVNINDWYVVTTAADDTIASELIRLVVISLGLCLLVNLVIIAITIYIDFSNQKQNRKLYKVAYIDPVTLLGNEAFFKENGAIYLQNHTNKNEYVVTLDINKFKALNNLYGYEFCNEILETLGRKLVAILPADNITCRISNDIFATVFTYKKQVSQLLDKIYRELSYVTIRDINVHLNLAIGAYTIKSQDTDINKILDKSYMARAQIKGQYHSNFYLFDERLEKELMIEQEIEACMEEALNHQEFTVIYQPKTFTSNEKMSGAEALIRWCRKGEIISPSKFIPLFEKNKFILKLDLYIFEQVCKDLANWREKYDYMPTISINVSKEHFVEENFINKYAEICKKYNIETSSIDLEITESATIDSNIDILKVMNYIKKQGFMLSIDDFGTGYSSLSMLQNMPIDIIKIDKAFVDKADLQTDDNMINYIMFMAERLGIRTIVEGVENKEQMEYVRRIGCDIIQGYYYSKPITKEEFEKYFIKNK
jgi:diguanylate cyclase (GGDEF)-like protein